MSETRGRRSETEPLEYHGEPLRRLESHLFLDGKQIEIFDMVLPKPVEGPFLAPFREGGLTISGEFSGALYPGAIERLTEAMRKHPDYCAACDGFPCQGGHPPAE